MNILVISREIPPVGGGAGSVALDLAEQLAASGHRLHIVTMHFGDLPSSETRGAVTIHRLRCGRRHQDSASLVSMLRFVVGGRRVARRLATTESFDIVHAHAIVPDGSVASHVGRRARIPVVATAHGTDVPGYDPQRYRWLHRALRPIWRRVVRKADLLTAPSQYLAGLIHRSDPSTQLVVIPNGVDTDLFLGSAASGSGFLIVSRLVERKNYHSFFEALAAIDEPQSIDVVGDGPEIDRLRRIAGATHHQVRFHGWLAHGSHEWRRLYEHSRFFVFPSLSENFPISLLEAQLAGLTVLASPIPGNREVLGDHAVYFSDLTAKGIAETIREVLALPDAERVERARRATERVRRDFSWQEIAQRYEEEYRRVVEAQSGS